MAPRFFILDDVQSLVTEQIRKSLNSDVTVTKMYWIWLPLPHLTLVNTNITNAHYTLTLPRTKIYPDWRIILGETKKPGRIILDKPEIHISSTAFLPGGAPEFLLPEVTIVINNGALNIDPPEEFKDILLADSLAFSSIRGRLKLLPQEIAAAIKATSPLSRDISLQGSFNIPAKKYQFSFESQGIELQESVKAMFGGRLIPVASRAALAGTVSGQALQYIQGDLHGTLPGFIVKSGDREIPLSWGFADLKFIRSGQLLRLDIKDLEVKDPRVKLSGHIERLLPAASSAEQPPPSEPVWTIDIAGRDLDLTAIRHKTLALWRDNSVAETVTHIVLGGEALSAAYHFTGRKADFKNLDAMIIEADILNAAIHVPGVDLSLTKAGGPIRIKDSILTGHGLSAQLGKSYGRNAELLLGLDAHDHAFRLDIDIDADLQDVPPVLARLVKHGPFQRELRKFSEVSGRANGTLHLGDNLKHVITRVNVKDMQLEARYEPIPAAIHINSGVLNIGPEKVDWLKVKGRIGQQKISSISGNVSWTAGNTLLHIDTIQAQLEGASLLALVQQTGIMKQKLDNVLSSLTGTIAITRGSLQGYAVKPESWEYDLGFASTGLTLTSPLLPDGVSSEKISGAINHKEADIQEAKIRFLEQTFELKGLLLHHLLENWHGMVEFNGPFQAKLANWVGSKGWFPEKLRPRIPCTLENLQVSWQGETYGVSGIILQGTTGGKLPLARLDLESTPERLRINELTFYALGEQGSMELEFWHLSPHRLVLSWKGLVNAETITALFEQSSFTGGTITGDFALRYTADQPEATRFEGLLQAKNLLMKTGDGGNPVVISALDMTGIGRQLRIPAFNLAVGSEKISGSGQLAAEKDGLQLDISLASSFFSGESLTNLWLAVQETENVFLPGRPDQKSGLQMARGWDITGRIGFDFESFALSRKTSTPYDEPQTVIYTFYDVLGDLQLAPDGITRTEIFSAKLCGLDFRGSWFSAPELGQELQLDTGPDKIFRLEDVLPCLGVQQDIIEGEFSLQATLLKESGRWYGGNIYIKSSRGRILRLKTLSRIFSVVNITDLFEKHVDNTGRRGFPFTQMNIDTHIHANNLIVDRAIILGEGLNLFARGEIHLDDYDTDLTLLIAPFKTFDSIVSKVPILGQQVTGEYGSRMSIPVAVKGPIADPIITPMHPEAVGEAVFNLLKDTFLLPYNILKPSEKYDK